MDLNIENGRFKPLNREQLNQVIADIFIESSIHVPYRINEFPYPINEWDVSLITNMNDLFIGKSHFNEDISNWDVSHVTNMKNMFYGCEKFSQPLNNWNVGNVTNMTSMFEGCKNFNQPLDNWNVRKVTNMKNMFEICHAFNQPLNNWNVSNVTNMQQMFYGCENFNQPLDNWNVRKVTNMIAMFYGCQNFNQPLDNWDVSNVTNMQSMFIYCYAFNQPLYWRLNPAIFIKRKRIEFSKNYPHFDKGVGLVANGTITTVEEYNLLDKKNIKKLTSELNIIEKRTTPKINKTSKTRNNVLLNPDLNKHIQSFLGGKNRKSTRKTINTKRK